MTNVRVLLVEDDPGFAHLLEERLADSDPELEVARVSSVETATAAVAGGSFACVLLDLGLPDAEGLAALRRIQDAGRRVPIVILSGRADYELERRAAAAGAADYLRKDEASGPLVARIIRYAVERDQHIEALQRGEMLRQSVIAGLPWGVIVREVTDGRLGRAILVNDNAHRLLEPDTRVPLEAEKLGTGLEYCDEDGNPITFADLPGVRAARDGHVVVDEILGMRPSPDKPVRWMLVSAHPLADGDGTPWAVVVAFFDITARRAAELAVRYQARLLDAVGQAVIATSVDGRVVYWNRAAEELYGWPASEAVGQPITDLTPADQTRAQAAEIMALLQAGAAWSGEFQVQRRDGSQFPALVTNSPVLDDDGALVGIIGVSIDITDRKQAEARSARLAALIESTDDAIILADLRGRITDWNLGAERLLGYRAGEVIGSLARVLFPDEGHARYEEIVHSLAEGGPPQRIQVPAVRRDGQLVELLLTLAPVRDRRGEVFALSAIGHDITAEREAEDERRILEERLRQTQRLESLGQLAGGVAHDFNNLLTIILNYAGFLVDDASDGPVDMDRIRPDLQRIVAAAERGAGLTRQLLAFSRKDMVHPERVDVNTAVTDVADLLRRTIPENIDLVTNTSDGELPVEIDPGQLDVVLVNLAVNAAHAMPDGGRLVIETSARTLTDGVPARGLPAGRYARIVVTDTGSGMPSDVVDRAFEPFFTTKAMGMGTGLGLATVYGVVKQAGGDVAIYSEVGLGTSIKIYLPALLETETLPADAPASPLPAARGPRTTILVAEDEEPVRSLLRRILWRQGYRVLTANDGAQALASLETAIDEGAPIPILITDLVMPNMSGPELIDRARQLDPRLQAILLSGYTAGELDDGGPAGTLFLEKPFSEQELVSVLAGITEERPA